MPSNLVLSPVVAAFFVERPSEIRRLCGFRIAVPALRFLTWNCLQISATQIPQHPIAIESIQVVV
jgi:hypothetical protein